MVLPRQLRFAFYNVLRHQNCAGELITYLLVERAAIHAATLPTHLCTNTTLCVTLTHKCVILTIHAVTARAPLMFCCPSIIEVYFEFFVQERHNSKSVSTAAPCKECFFNSFYCTFLKSCYLVEVMSKFPW